MRGLGTRLVNDSEDYSGEPVKVISTPAVHGLQAERIAVWDLD